MSDDNSKADTIHETIPYPVIGGDIPPPPPLPPPPPPPPAFDTAIKLKVAHSIDHDSTTTMQKTESSAPENQSTSNSKSGGLLGDIKNFKKEGILKKVTPDMIAKPKVEKRTPGNAAELLAQFMDARVSKNFPSNTPVGTI